MRWLSPGATHPTTHPPICKVLVDRPWRLPKGFLDGLGDGAIKDPRFVYRSILVENALSPFPRFCAGRHLTSTVVRKSQERSAILSRILSPNEDRFHEYLSR